MFCYTVLGVCGRFSSIFVRFPHVSAFFFCCERNGKKHEVVKENRVPARVKQRIRSSIIASEKEYEERIQQGK